ncbi:MAG: hypothetical protein JXR04_13220 [Bermanella sp.]|tara:strand:- start:92 stop:604 length:513 start_codon:yes stop_codon:yes gene_type:complete
MMKTKFQLIVSVTLLLFSGLSIAELTPLNDVTLSAHVGQISQRAANDKPFQVPLLLSESQSTQTSPQNLNTQASQNQPSAGITIDIDLQLHIDEIRWVDVDGAGPNGTQGAISMRGFSVGHLDGPTAQPAQIRGITVDADGRDGLVIGVEQIGDRFGNGIDINIDSIQIK